MSETRYDILTYFDTCVDIIADIGCAPLTFTQNEELLPSIDAVLGGTACIFASGCAKLGLRTAGPGIIGTDAFGEIVRNALIQNGVDIGLLEQDSRVKTSVSIALCRSEGRTILTYDRSITALSANALTAKTLASARHLHIAGYYLLTGVQTGLIPVVEEAKRLGLTVSLDTNWDPDERWELPHELLRHVDILLPNETEVCRLSGESDIDRAAAYFLEHVPVVAVKRGEEGATLFRKGERYDGSPPKVNCKDAVGAGDSFDAGFVYGFLNGLSWPDCLRAALFCGAMNVRETGGVAGQATLSELKAYLQTHGGN